MLKIVCIVKNNNGKIIEVGVINPLTPLKILKMKVEYLIELIKKGIKYETEGGVHSGAEVKVNKNDELYTERDGFTDNNLSSLKSCPI